MGVKECGVATRTTRVAGRVGSWLSCVLFVSTFLACSGGGGGEGGGGVGRTRDTAIRVMHGSIDAAPVQLLANSVFHQETKFGIDQPYIPIVDGAVSLQGVKPVTLEEMFRRSDTVAKDTESTLLVFGSAGDDTLETELITDRIERPVEGRAAVRFYHALTGRSRVRLNCAAIGANGQAGEEITLAARYGDASEYGELPSGVIDCRATDSEGTELAAKQFAVTDRGELGVLLTGSLSLDYIVLRGYADLD